MGNATCEMVLSKNIANIIFECLYPFGFRPQKLTLKEMLHSPGIQGSCSKFRPTLAGLAFEGVLK